MKKRLLFLCALITAMSIQAGNIFQWDVYENNYSINRKGDIDFKYHLPCTDFTKVQMAIDNILYIEGVKKGFGGVPVKVYFNIDLINGSTTILKEPQNLNNINIQNGIQLFCANNSVTYFLETDGVYKEENGKRDKISEITGKNIAYSFDKLWILQKDYIISIDPETGETINQWNYNQLLPLYKPIYMFVPQNKNSLILVSSESISILYSKDYPNIAIDNLYSNDIAQTLKITDYQYLPSGKKVVLANSNRMAYTKYKSVIGTWDGNKWSGVDYNMHLIVKNNIYNEPSMFIKSFAIDDNTLYVSRKAGLAQIDQQTGKITEVKAYTAGMAERMCLDKNSNLWACTSKGVVFFDGNTCTLFDKKVMGIPVPNNANQMMFDTGGTLWIAADNGLFCKKNDEWTVFNKKNGALPFNGIKKFRIHNGRIYILKDGGLLAINKGYGWLENGKYTAINTETGFADHLSDFDDNGNLWYVTKDGIHCANENGDKIVFPSKNTPIELPIIVTGFHIIDGKIIVIVSGYHSNAFGKEIVANGDNAAIYRNKIRESVEKTEDDLYGSMILTFDIPQ